MLRLGGASALSLALGGLMTLLIGLLIVNFVGQVIQNARLEHRRLELEAEVARIQAENAVLAGAVAFTESDVYAERVAREQLGYAREGDVVIFPREARPTATPSVVSEIPAPEPVPTPIANWRLWWWAFFPPSEPF